MQREYSHWYLDHDSQASAGARAFVENVRESSVEPEDPRLFARTFDRRQTANFDTMRAHLVRNTEPIAQEDTEYPPEHILRQGHRYHPTRQDWNRSYDPANFEWEGTGTDQSAYSPSSSVVGRYRERRQARADEVQQYLDESDEDADLHHEGDEDGSEDREDSEDSDEEPSYHPQQRNNPRQVAPRHRRQMRRQHEEESSEDDSEDDDHAHYDHSPAFNQGHHWDQPYGY